MNYENLVEEDAFLVLMSVRSLQSCWLFVPVALHDYMFAGLNIHFTARAASGGVWEESLAVFTDGGMSSGHVGESSV